MKTLKYYFFLGIIIVLFGCDPSYEIEWRVLNNTNDNINIYSESFQDTIKQFNCLGSKLNLTLYNDFEFGTVGSYIKYTKEIPFDTLIILNSKGDTIKKDVYLIDNWKAKNIDDRIAEYTLEVNSDDF